MRINPVSFAVCNKKVNNSRKGTSFKGDSRPLIVNVRTEENLSRPFNPDAFSTGGEQICVAGKLPLKRLEGTYEPDVMALGQLYYAEQGEYVGDWVMETHTGVIADFRRLNNLTMERVLDAENDTPNDILMMRNTLWHDVRHNKEKLHKLGVSTDEINKKDDEMLAKKGEAALHSSIKAAKESALDEKEKLIARYREVREMKRIADKNQVESDQYMQSHNLNYYDANPEPIVQLPEGEP